MPAIVTSSSNTQLKLLRRLATRRGRLREGCFCVEGEDIVRAGLDAGWLPRCILVDSSATVGGDGIPALIDLVGEDNARRCSGRVTVVDSPLMAAVSAMGHPARVVAVFELPQDVAWDGPRVDAGDTPRLYLDGVRDPGNVGTVLRSAAAFGVSEVALGPGSADPFGSKAVRASMGAIFHVDVRLAASVAEFAQGTDVVVALDARAEHALWDVDMGVSPVLCIGAERDGLTASTIERAGVVACIPQHSHIDSLNAAMTATTALYEWQRQQER